jgi:hypothetical protein
VTAAIPYGGSERDFDAVRGDPRPPALFDPRDGAFHVVYAGALLPRAMVVLERLLAGVALLRERKPALAARLRMHFIGTGKAVNDPRGYNVLPLVERYGVGEIVHEHPARIPYTEVLRHLLASSAILILGSTEAHYTPSKAFQAVMARRPVLALLHRASTAAEFLQRANAARVVTLEEHDLPAASQLAAELAALIEGDGASRPDVRWELLEQYSARSGARVLATALDQALLRERARAG